MSFASVDAGAGQGPFLRVTYTSPATQANDTDSTSITAYGTQAITLVDDSIESDAEAALRAAIELAKRKDPMEYGSLQTYAAGISVGDLVHIESASHDIDDDFLVRAVRVAWLGDDLVLYTIDYGDHTPDVARLIRELNAVKESQT